MATLATIHPAGIDRRTTADTRVASVAWVGWAAWVAWVASGVWAVSVAREVLAARDLRSCQRTTISTTTPRTKRATRRARWSGTWACRRRIASRRGRTTSMPTGMETWHGRLRTGAGSPVIVVSGNRRQPHRHSRHTGRPVRLIATPRLGSPARADLRRPTVAHMAAIAPVMEAAGAAAEGEEDAAGSAKEGDPDLSASLPPARATLSRHALHLGAQLSRTAQ